MMYERFLAWYKKSKETKKGRLLPANVLIYRDGVSESQYGMVLEQEMPEIIRGCKMAFDQLKSQDPEVNKVSRSKFTLLVVTKRHHTRFYPRVGDRHHAGTKKYNRRLDANLESGMVVDRTVVKPNIFSFYLQSHHSPLGTARNGHYVVVYDENEFREAPLKLQSIVSEAYNPDSPTCAKSWTDAQSVLYRLQVLQGAFILHSSPIC